MVMLPAAVARFSHPAPAEEISCLQLLAWQEVRRQAIIVDYKQQES